LAPALQPGLQLQAAFGFSSSRVAWSLQLGARMARRDRLVSPDGEAWFGFVAGIVRVCGATPLGSTRFALSGCAVAEPGVFSAGAENTTNPRSYARAWLALGAAAELSLRLAAWLNLRAGAELLAPLRRDHMSLAGDTVYRVPRLGSRLQIGIEIPFG
ncbi:MAG TPA: hypothetical protein VFN67_33705, partial [Polyangiales bacterium]|nr:hypothetical protein [Polyangiales bacterium]